MANPGLQGWATDPFGLHEARYFSAGQPTKLVRDAGVESFDEPPSSPGHSPDERAAAAARATTVVMPVVTAEPGPPRSDGPDNADPDDPYPYGPGSARVPRRRPWDGVGWAAIAVLAAAALVIGVVVAETPKPVTTLDTGPAATVAFVSQAVQATMAQRTADVTLSGTAQVSGQTAVVHGTGVFGLSGNVGTLDATVSFPGRMVAEREILVNGSAYVAISVNGKSEALPGGKTWIQVSLPQARTGRPDLGLGTDPSSGLSALEAHGNTVQAVGTKSVGGRVCSGYVISAGVQTLVPMTITIWVDSRHMVREMSMSMTLNVAGEARSADMTMDFTSFGGPVQVTAPAPASVISYAAYMQPVGQGSVP